MLIMSSLCPSLLFSPKEMIEKKKCKEKKIDKIQMAISQLVE